MAVDRAPVYEFAFEAAQHRLDEQAATLEGYRTRAATVISAAAIATSFLGGLALRRHNAPLNRWDWAAIVCFGGSVLAALAVIIPIGGWVFTNSATKLIGTYVECDDPYPVWRVHRDEALNLDIYAERNRERLKWVGRSLVASGVLLVAETALWVVAATQ